MDERDPEEVLREAGAGPSKGAIVYLSPLQLETAIEELKNQLGLSADIIAVEACAFYLNDCLYRARVANNRAHMKPR